MFTISQIAKTVKGTIDGNPDITILGVCDLKNSCNDHLSYISSSKYEKFFHQSTANAILVGNDFSIDRKDKTLIRVSNPAISFIEVIQLFHPQDKPKEEIHSSAVVSSSAVIGENIYIAPHAVIEEMLPLVMGYKLAPGHLLEKIQPFKVEQSFIQM